MEKEIIGGHSSLALAFLGDAVYTLAVRRRLVTICQSRPAKLSALAASYVNAAAQARFADAVLPVLSEEESEIYRRGRNANPKTVAKHQTMADYRKATGLESLFGYLHLCGREERIEELIDQGLAACGFPAGSESPANKEAVYEDTAGM